MPTQLSMGMQNDFHHCYPSFLTPDFLANAPSIMCRTPRDVAGYIPGFTAAIETKRCEYKHETRDFANQPTPRKNGCHQQCALVKPPTKDDMFHLEYNRSAEQQRVTAKSRAILPIYLMCLSGCMMSMARRAWAILGQRKGIGGRHFRAWLPGVATANIGGVMRLLSRGKTKIPRPQTKIRNTGGELENIIQPDRPWPRS